MIRSGLSCSATSQVRTGGVNEGILIFCDVQNLFLGVSPIRFTKFGVKPILTRAAGRGKQKLMATESVLC